ncbi:hypothetical protein [Streptomyces sp. NPDC101150]|uniref:hypothetical protein n=1 Tax=Streptomyces sp. NPDC101150 TaxID=3366114 RepID=UPI0037F7EF6A
MVMRPRELQAVRGAADGLPAFSATDLELAHPQNCARPSGRNALAPMTSAISAMFTQLGHGNSRPRSVSRAGSVGSSLRRCRIRVTEIARWTNGAMEP